MDQKDTNQTFNVMVKVKEIEVVKKIFFSYIISIDFWVLKEVNNWKIQVMVVCIYVLIV